MTNKWNVDTKSLFVTDDSDTTTVETLLKDYELNLTDIMAVDSHSQIDSDSDLSGITTSSGTATVSGNLTWNNNNNYWATTAPSIGYTSNAATYYGLDSMSGYFQPKTNFTKITRMMSEVDYINMIELLRSEDIDDYYGVLYDVLTHQGFRLLPEQYMVEVVEDIRHIEEMTDFMFVDHFDMDKYPALKVLFKLI